MKTLKIKAAVLHVNTAARTSNSPTMRIARYAADTLGVPLIHDTYSARHALRQGKLEVLFVKHGMLKFSEHREEAIKLYRAAGTVVNLENDYTFTPDARMRREGPTSEAWSTVEGRTRYVNWNVLTWLPLDTWKKGPRPQVAPTKRGIIYYGAYREGRVESFKRYFLTTKYPVTISSFRGGAKFTALCGHNVKTIGAFRDPTGIQQYQMTIYIEDQQSHSLYCSPANRFYECLQLGVAQVFDNATVHTLELAGIKVPKCQIVCDASEVRDALIDVKHIRLQQRDSMWCDYTAQLQSQLMAACRASFGAKCWA